MQDLLAAHCIVFSVLNAMHPIKLNAYMTRC
jgi:hypothetical protein